MEMQNISRKRLAGTLLLFLLLCTAVLLFGRRTVLKQQKEKEQEYSTTGFAFDTTYTIHLYRGGSQELINQCVQKCAEYERIFSRTQEDSELYQINQLSRQHISEEGSLEITVSEDMAALIRKGLDYGVLSGGIFDITIEPVSRLWDFTAEKPAVPEAGEIQSALPFVDYRQLSLQQKKLVISKPGVCLDLGGIAKGYIADCLKDYLQKQGVSSGMINLGGNVLCIGEKPDGSAFRIGVQHPFAEQNKSIIVVAVKGCSVVSSGIYERCFTENGIIYHHILNPETGYPRENDLMAVTIVSEASVDGDGLSTTCFGLGLEKGMKLINSMDGVTAVFITKDEKLHYADGFQELLIP